ncbi:MAG: flagellar basal body P-ring formation protein FlgA [Magnetococcales bacterium]|nr:flagellar basal body P-ring formation protein FlgA [Magnetococcales bacterium]
MANPAQLMGILLVMLGFSWHGDLLARQVDRNALTGLVEKQLAIALAQRGDGFVATRLYCLDGLEIGEGPSAGPTGQSVPGSKAAADKASAGAAGKGSGTLSVTMDLAQAALEPGRREFPVSVLEDGVARGQVRFMAILQQEKSLLVLRRPLQRGEVVREADLEEKSLTLTRPTPGVLGAEQMDKVQGLMARRSLSAGTPLQSSWFESPAAVDRGEHVRVRLSRGGLKIETNGVAMAKGRVGESIEVQNSESRRRFLARIVSPGHVEVMVP